MQVAGVPPGTAAGQRRVARPLDRPHLDLTVAIRRRGAGVRELSFRLDTIVGMAHLGRSCSLLLALTLAASGDAVTPARAELDRSCLPGNLRADSAWIADIACRHLARSPTLTRLRDELAAARVVVYMHDAANADDGIEGRLRLIGAASGWCYLRIDLHRQRSDAASAALVAHELQHALEVADAGIVDRASWQALFARIGIRDGRRPGHVDTAEAILAGVATLRELTGHAPLGPVLTRRALRALGINPDH